ncbi:nociceptin receptor-like [Pomacea canaliculata]|uniref:nociceptin receptor-like n=1 Tax=Pomacea canaliculata TaxID=400727 RepID=UPI000D72C1D8|nr:nociceptin receptor-like [Pomacea canaliculata]XP_025083358.1 nociceptin receptor-like [Pomacea canaliculata]
MEALDPAVRAMSYNWTIILDSNNMTGVPADSSPEMEDSLRCNTNDTDGYKQFYETAQMVTGLIIYPILCISGITGNTLSLIVLSHRDMATSTNVYLFALGVSDTLKLLNDLLYFIMLVISLNDPPAAETMMVNVYPYAHYFFTVAVCVTAWLTVAVAMDRFVAVCHPSRSKALCTIARARSVSVTIFVGMLLLSVPSAFRYRMQAVHDRQQNVTCMEIVTTELGRNKQIMVPYTWAQNLMRGIIPVFILIYLNARIINVLRKERVKGKKLSSRNRITLMLIAVIVAFIVCITPDAIMSTFFGKGYVEEDNKVKGVREITDSLLALNSAINFVLYCTLSLVFRNTFCKVFCAERFALMQHRSSKCIRNGEETHLQVSVYDRDTTGERCV